MEKYSEFDLFEDNLKFALSSLTGLVKTPEQIKKAFERYKYLKQQDQSQCQNQNNK